MRAPSTSRSSGSGFAGSLLALVARRLGRSVVLLEKGTHPRFAIGESSSPLANLLLEEIADAVRRCPALLPAREVGLLAARVSRRSPRAEARLQLLPARRGPCRSRTIPDREDQLLVAASPNDEVADTHWYRPEFDHFRLEEADAAGVEYSWIGHRWSDVARERGRWGLTGERAEGSFPSRTFPRGRLGPSVALRDALGVGAASPSFPRRRLSSPTSKAFDDSTKWGFRAAPRLRLTRSTTRPSTTSFRAAGSGC